MDDLSAYVETLGKNARRVAGQLATLTGAAKTDALRRMAAAIRAGRDALINANKRDIDAAMEAKLNDHFARTSTFRDPKIYGVFIATRDTAIGAAS